MFKVSVTIFAALAILIAKNGGVVADDNEEAAPGGHNGFNGTFIEGDCEGTEALLEQYEQDYVYDQPKDVVEKVVYPKENSVIGEIRCVVIDIYDSSFDTNVFGEDGGIGKDHLTVSIEAQSADKLIYKMFIYGFPKDKHADEETAAA